MAAKRISKSAINWAAINERVPGNQKTNYFAFKSKNDSYLKRVFQFPENPPKIDWDLYKQKISVPGMVDSFQKSYQTLNIPYPPDNVTKLIDDQEKTVKSEIAAFKEKSQNNIKEFESKLAHLNSLIPIEEMTMEDFKDAYPDLALDSIKKPTFWPHDEEEQKDYRDKGHPLYGHDPHAH